MKLTAFACLIGTTLAQGPLPTKGTAPYGAYCDVPGGPAVLSPIVGDLTTGPYRSGFYEEQSLPRHTIFAPINPPAGLKLPVFIWGNGACSPNGTLFRRSLWEVASHGFLAIANGAASCGGPSTNYKMMIESMDWISKMAGQAGSKYSNVDATKIAVGGTSCGGIESYNAGSDSRVSTIGIFNSGFRNASEKVAVLNKPIFYFLGGPSDMAYPNGERDYKALSNTTTPRWKGNLDVGHLATWNQTNGGKFGKAELLWLDWMLRGNETSSRFFLGDGAKQDGWVVESANLDRINASRISGNAPGGAYQIG